LDNSLHSLTPYSREDIEDFAEIMKKYAENVSIRA